jgi:hypothetical protein
METEVFEGATLIEPVLEEVDDFLVGDIDYGCTLVEKATHVLADRLTLLLLDHRQIHVSTRASHSTREVAGELGLQLVLLVDRVLVEQLEPCEWSLVQTEGEVDAFGVVVATSVFDAQGIAPEPLN